MQVHRAAAMVNLERVCARHTICRGFNAGPAVGLPGSAAGVRPEAFNTAFLGSTLSRWPDIVVQRFCELELFLLQT